MTSIDELLNEAIYVSERFWFVQALRMAERTDNTITLHMQITDEMFVQIFFSQRSLRLSFALVNSAGRVYGRDREHGLWHRHPFGQPHEHESTPEGMSSRPLTQFLAEVEELLLTNGLI
jgi:hypothetical protein